MVLFNQLVQGYIMDTAPKVCWNTHLGGGYEKLNLSVVELRLYAIYDGHYFQQM